MFTFGIKRVRMRIVGWYMIYLVDFADGQKMRFPRYECRSE